MRFGFTRDLRAALHRLAQTPSVVAATILTLALGIGLAAATGVIARTIAFATIPAPDPDRVAVLWGEDGAGSFTHLPLPPADIGALTLALRDVATVAASDYNGAYPWVFEAPDGGVPLRLRGTLAGGNFFELLGVRPLLGRTLRPDDDVIGAPRVVVLDEHTWRTRFGADPGVIGRVLRAPQYDAPYTIVGVVPAGLDLPRGVQFWTAFAPTAARNGSLEQTPWAADVVARLAPGRTLDDLRRALEGFYARLAREGKDVYAGARAHATLLPQLISGDVRPVFTAFTVAGALVLLVTGANVVSLLLVRAGRRRREFAVRVALGATRRRLAGELLAEVVPLAVVGGGLGALVAMAALRLFVQLAPASIPRLDTVRVDWMLFVVVAALSAFVTLLVGLAPALVAARAEPAEALGPARAGAGGTPASVTLRSALVAGQVAMALVVVVAATLGSRALLREQRLDLGMPHARSLAFFELTVPIAATGTRDPAAATAWWRTTLDAILAGVAATPGVIAVAPVTATPFSGTGGWDGRLSPVGVSPEDSARRPYLNMEVTTADYLTTTGLALRDGRWIASTDRENTPRVVVLSQQAAGTLFPGGRAVGQRVALWGDLQAEVVGVVDDSRYREFENRRPSVYFPYRQFDGSSLFLMVRAPLGVAALDASVRAVVRQVNPAILVQANGTMGTFLDRALARTRLVAAVLGVYGVLAILLAVIGLYAVVAGGVATRRREFGVRIALGATPTRLMQLVLGEGMRLAAIGACVGLAATLAVARTLGALVHGVPATDPLTLALAVLLLLAVCLLAVALPARRATRTDAARELQAD